MMLCFFSLLASMMANINEQNKEIGVLLAIGLEYVWGAWDCANSVGRRPNVPSHASLTRWS